MTDTLLSCSASTARLTLGRATPMPAVPMHVPVNTSPPVTERPKATTIDSVSIRGFRSIRSLDAMEMRPLNVIIGANGGGKSNFLDSFEFFCRAARPFLEHAQEKGHIDSAQMEVFDFLHPNAPGEFRRYEIDRCLYVGEAGAEDFSTAISAGGLEWSISIPADGGRLRSLGLKVEDIEGSITLDTHGGGGTSPAIEISRGDPNGLLPRLATLAEALSSWVRYDFGDIKRTLLEGRGLQSDGRPPRDDILARDGSNIAALLARTKREHEWDFKNIDFNVKQSLPFIEDLLVDGSGDNYGTLHFGQRHKGKTFDAGQLSEGSLRIICLVAALMQHQPPSTIILDQPDLALHHDSISSLSYLVHVASRLDRQVIMTTQSPFLLGYFEPEEVVVIDRRKGESLFRRLDFPSLEGFLEDYSLGDLWLCNDLRGGPEHE